MMNRILGGSGADSTEAEGRHCADRKHINPKKMMCAADLKCVKDIPQKALFKPLRIMAES